MTRPYPYHRPMLACHGCGDEDTPINWHGLCPECEEEEDADE